MEQINSVCTVEAKYGGDSVITVLRREEKYPLSLKNARIYSNMLSAVLMSDGFSGDGGYMVRSLYFDTPDEKIFLRK